MAWLADEGNAGGQDRLIQIAAGGDAKALVVQIGALALFGPEHLVADRIIGHTGHDHAVTFQRRCHRKMGDGVQEVGGAVERVNDPAKVITAFDDPGFFGEDFFLAKCRLFLLSKG